LILLDAIAEAERNPNCFVQEEAKKTYKPKKQAIIISLNKKIMAERQKKETLRQELFLWKFHWRI
jgi:sRNA-binding protein